jgi:hypothetical protein
LMFLNLRVMLLELLGLQAQFVAKIVLFKWICAFKLLTKIIKQNLFLYILTFLWFT